MLHQRVGTEPSHRNSERKTLFLKGISKFEPRRQIPSFARTRRQCGIYATASDGKRTALQTAAYDTRRRHSVSLANAVSGRTAGKPRSELTNGGQVGIGERHALQPFAEEGAGNGDHAGLTRQPVGRLVTAQR